MDDGASFMSNDMDAQDTVGLGIGENLHEPVGMALRPCAAVRRKREASLAIGNAGLFQCVLAPAKRGNFGRRIDNSRNQPVIDMTGMTGHHLDSGNTILLGLVGEHRPIDHIADGIDVLNRCLEPGINLDPAALGHGNARILKPETVCRRMSSNGDKRHISLQRFGITAAGRLNRQRDTILAGLGRLDSGLQAEGQALLFGYGHEFLRDLVIHAGENPRQEFDHLDLGAKARPDGAELQADIAGADDNQLLRHLRQRQRAGRADNPRLVDLDAGKAGSMAPGGDQDPLGGIVSGVGPVGERDLASTVYPGMALKPRDLVLLEQEIDPAGQAADDLVLALHHPCQVKLDISNRDAQRGQSATRRIGVMFGRVEKRLRGNAPDIQTGAAKAVTPVDTGHLHAKLCGPDGGDIAARAGADHDQVECGIAHRALPACIVTLRRGRCRQTPRTRRRGSSIRSLTLARKDTASRPSMIRWS